MIRFLLLVLALGFVVSSLASAMPPLVYESALKASDETLKSPIKKANRIYILGPEKVTESYVSNGKPAKHEVEILRVLAAKSGLTLGEAVTQTSFKRDGNFTVLLYRKTDSTAVNTSTPYFTAPGRMPFTSSVALKPRDVILLRYEQTNAIP